MSNVLELNRFKITYNKYLKSLSFSELMDESNYIMDFLKEGATYEAIAKSKLLQDEFARRLDKESSSLAAQVRQLQEQIHE